MRDTHGMNSLEHAQLMVVSAVSAAEGGVTCSTPECQEATDVSEELAIPKACDQAVTLRVVCMLTGRLLCEVSAERNWPAIDVKMQIELELGIPCRKQHLLTGSNLLDDDVPLSNISGTQPAGSEWTVYLLTEVSRLEHDDCSVEDQNQINGEAHTMLVDWLVKVHIKYRFGRETLFLAVSLLDRYLAQAAVPLERLKLVGITAMRIAAKYEESNLPSLADFVRICDNACTPEEFHVTENSMLSALEFRLYCPTTAHFLMYPENGVDIEMWGHICFTNYLAELSLHDIAMLRYEPSEIAAAARFLSGEIIGSWPRNAPKDCWKTWGATDECISDLRNLMKMFSSNRCQMSRNRLMLYLTEEQSIAISHAGC